jgi:hypothetical protein
MKLKSFFQITAIVILISMTIGITSAAKVTIEDVSFDSPGEEKTVRLYLDEAPGGLAGYILNLSVDPLVAKVVNVEYPDWASMKDTKGLESGTDVQLSALDLSKSIQDGSGKIELATVTFQGSRKGSTIIHMYHDTFDDDAGNSIARTLYDGTLIVGDATPATTMPTTVSAQSTQASQASQPATGESTEPVRETKTAATPIPAYGPVLTVIAGILIFAYGPSKKEK